MTSLFARLVLFPVLLLVARPVFSIESSMLASVKDIPVEMRTVITCGYWEEGPSSGHYRLIVADVSFGAGTEVYLQWIRTRSTDHMEPEVIETVSFPQLNNDHGQYDFYLSKCSGRGKNSVFELKGSYEHDVSDLEHQVTIKPMGIGKYKIAERVRKAKKTR